MRPDVLVVAEKDSVAKAFAEALSGGRYRVRVRGPVKVYVFEREGRRWASIGLKGHLFDFDFEEELNRSWRSVDPRELFFAKPLKVPEEGSEPYIEALRELGRGAELVYLALDGDPEGEGIAFEAMSVISKVNPYAEFKRPWFSTLNPEELRRAIANAGEPNPRLAEKCFARMEVDLTIGAAFTRLLTLSVQRLAPRSLPLGRFLSYGPCQSPVLYLVVQRAMERESFKPETFYRVVASLRGARAELKVEHVKGRFKDRGEAEAAYRRARLAAMAVVRGVEERPSVKEPPTPLNTVELESRASRFLNIRPKQALDIAEELYRRGYISYPRTETEIYSPMMDLRSIVAEFRGHPVYGIYASRILSGPIRPTRGSKDDKAHPPIHPVRAALREEVVSELGVQAWRLYDLVVRHFMATLSPPARLARQRVVVDLGGELFEATGLAVIDKGYLNVYPFEEPDEKPLPALSEGAKLAILAVELKEGKTEPPPYLSESELLKLMERLRIGTDATASQHIQTNLDRGYFYIEGRRCIPTPLGMALIKALLEIKPELVKPEVRSFIESQINEVAEGRRTREEVVESAKKVFLSYYDEVKRREVELAKAVLPTISESLRIAEEKARRRRRSKRPLK
ncbi:DNA topoisomerase III [Candidatus Geothermarchaeota archaeon ex4572_27]|nr:MAG: DNA topoisomerase III [Candidatus Geothermarchaeota archaeon ex4572_27]